MSACCEHPKSYHCKVGAGGLWISEGRFRRLVRCQHAGAFATDERAVCTSGSCAICDCPGLPAPKPRKKKEEGTA